MKSRDAIQASESGRAQMRKVFYFELISVAVH